MWFDELTNLDSGQVLLTYEFDIHVCLNATVDSPTFTPLSQPFLMNLCFFSKFEHMYLFYCFVCVFGVLSIVLCSLGKVWFVVCKRKGKLCLTF